MNGSRKLAICMELDESKFRTMKQKQLHFSLSKPKPKPKSKPKPKNNVLTKQNTPVIGSQ
jgi:hypothetical protein